MGFQSAHCGAAVRTRCRVCGACDSFRAWGLRRVVVPRRRCGGPHPQPQRPTPTHREVLPPHSLHRDRGERTNQRIPGASPVSADCVSPSPTAVLGTRSCEEPKNSEALRQAEKSRRRTWTNAKKSGAPMSRKQEGHAGSSTVAFHLDGLVAVQTNLEHIAATLAQQRRLEVTALADPVVQHTHAPDIHL